MVTPVTEDRNEITRNIDVASAKDIVHLLDKCDSEIFHGWGDFASSQSLLSTRVLKAITLVQCHAETILEDPEGNSQILIAGCGTSGRLAFLTAWNMNRILLETFKGTKKPCFDYMIAGGDRALFTSQETFEDDPVAGAELLKEISSDKRHVLYIGITCGLSAPFIAGQIDFCLKNLDKFTPVLIGFNPINLARRTQIEKLGKRSFYDLMEFYQEMVLKERAVLINPVVGPEAICGSSRMKGGTTTKIILDIIFTAAFCRINSNLSEPFQTKKWIQCYENVCKDFYKQNEKISHVVEAAGRALKSDGHVYYLGEGNLGITGLIDASECPPTFGTDLNDFRSFLFSGYTTLKNREGDLTNYGEEYSISLEYFQNKIKNNLEETDLLICLIRNSNMDFVKPFISDVKCKVVLANFLWKCDQIPLSTDRQHKTLNFVIPYQMTELITAPNMIEFWSLSFSEITAKIFLNSVSTGAHILKGKVLENLMIDMKPSNNKLFHRCLGIIQRFSGLSEEKCLEFLLRSIYDSEMLSAKIMADPVATYVDHSFGRTGIVPVALVASLKNCSIREAKEILLREPIIRNAISAALNPAV